MHKIQSLICIKSALTYISTINRRKRQIKNPEDFSEINQELKTRILNFAIQTLLVEMNETFRGLMNEIVFIILREGCKNYIIIFNEFCTVGINNASQFVQIFAQQLLSKQRINTKIGK
jgi:hypothetical protein